MFITDGTNIRIPRGDTASVPFTFFTGEDGEETPYRFAAGQDAELAGCAVKGAEPVITKTAARSSQLADGTVFLNFSSADTDIGRGKYIYTVRLLTGEGGSADTWLGAVTSAEFEII